MKYKITLAQLQYGNIDVEANNREEAKKKALELANKNCDNVRWFESKSYKVAEVYKIGKEFKMKTGDLIAVEGNLYEYGGIEKAEYSKELTLHKVYIIDIDEEGILTSTGITSYLTNEELSNRGIDLTEAQWIGLVKHFLRQDYDLTEEEMEDAANEIVCRCFTITRIPLVEELPNYIAIYMDR